jgi:hypothetical protein
MSKVALIVIYNHRYDDNIEIIERIYKNRFSCLFHLMPFYDGDKPGVIPVYENSIYFQGYIAQGFTHYYKPEFDHYLFVADDLILNPNINEGNYSDYFKLNPDTSFIPNLLRFNEMKYFWPRNREAFDFKIRVRGLEVVNELPSSEVARRKFEKFNIEPGPLRYKQIFRIPGKSAKAWLRALYKNKRDIFLYLTDKLFPIKYNLRYPLIGSYSDISIVSGRAIKEFCHLCGVFAAANLHVEIALPTSIVLSASYLITEKDLEKKGRALWPDGWNCLHGEDRLAKDDYKELEKYGLDLGALMDEFPEKYLYIHPIKLSKWNAGNLNNKI